MNGIVTGKTYCKLYVINELLFGQGQEQITSMQRDMDISLNIDYQNCYILLSGVKKTEYNQRLHLNRNGFVELVFGGLHGYVEQIAREERVSMEFGVLNYDYSKRIVIFLSPALERYDPLPVARRISSWLESQYRMYGEPDPHFSNVMAVSERVVCFDQIHTAFESLLELYQLSFFHRTSQPITHELMHERRIPYSIVEAERIINDFTDAIYRQESETAEGLLHQLMIGSLKPCQDMSFCREACDLLKQKVHSIGLVLGIPMNVMDDFPNMEGFLCIEEQYEAMRRFVEEHLLRQRRKAGTPGRLSILAMTYMQQNYYKNIGLTDIAKYIHTNTTYLSRVFKQEMGVGLLEYLNRLRVDQAARLLIETNLKIAHVAERVGIGDAHYFSSLFKRYAGMSPSEYRNEHGGIPVWCNH